MSKEYTDEQIMQMIEDDYRFICDWQGTKVDQKELNRLIKVNFEDFKKHLEEFGDIADFKYK